MGAMDDEATTVLRKRRIGSAIFSFLLHPTCGATLVETAMMLVFVMRQ